jgi:hypothetical protein
MPLETSFGYIHNINTKRIEQISAWPKGQNEFGKKMLIESSILTNGLNYIASRDTEYNYYVFKRFKCIYTHMFLSIKHCFQNYQ